MRQLLLAIVFALTGASASAQLAYIPNQNDNNMSVINTATNSVVATVAVGQDPMVWP